MLFNLKKRVVKVLSVNLKKKSKNWKESRNFRFVVFYKLQVNFKKINLKKSCAPFIFVKCKIVPHLGRVFLSLIFLLKNEMTVTGNFGIMHRPCFSGYPFQGM